MKTFQEFCSQLDESSLIRIKSKSDKGGMAILSGSRADKSKAENKARAKQLDRDIKGKGLPGATKAQIKRAFVKSLKTKKLNKKVLGEFISLVA